MNNNLLWVRIFKTGFAAALALVTSYFFAGNEFYWAPLTAVLVMQTSLAVILRQGILYFIAIVMAVMLGTLLVLMLNHFYLSVVSVIIFLVCGYVAIKKSHRYLVLSWPMIFILTYLLAVAMPVSTVYDRIFSITLGAIIGLLVNLIIFPLKADKIFRIEMVLLLQNYKTYLAAIMQLLFKEPDAILNAQIKKHHVMQLLCEANGYPAWVYDTGLSIPLQPGHRHFLVMIERLGQIQFAMHHLARHMFDERLLQSLKPELFEVARQAQHIMDVIISVLNLEQLKESVSDLSDEIAQLENVFKRQVPLSLELIDMSKDYIYLTAFIEDFQDLRSVLIKLGLALAQSARPIQMKASQ